MSPSSSMPRTNRRAVLRVKNLSSRSSGEYQWNKRSNFKFYDALVTLCWKVKPKCNRKFAFGSQILQFSQQ